MNKISGFILLEVAIALVILSLMAGFALPVYNQYLKAQKIKKTDEHFEVIIHALGGYVLRTGRIPCPATPTTETNLQGVEASTCNWNSSFTGVVPFKTLGLKVAEVKDGWGHFISYTVNPDLVLNDMEVRGYPKRTDGFCEVKKSETNLKVLGEKNEPLVLSTTDQFIAFVLVSHGPSGGGAQQDNGTRITTADSDKQRNASGGSEFINKLPTSTFDDRLSWITRDQLMLQFTHTPCHHR